MSRLIGLERPADDTMIEISSADIRRAARTGLTTVGTALTSIMHRQNPLNAARGKISSLSTTQQLVISDPDPTTSAQIVTGLQRQEEELHELVQILQQERTKADEQQRAMEEMLTTHVADVERQELFIAQLQDVIAEQEQALCDQQSLIDQLIMKQTDLFDRHRRQRTLMMQTLPEAMQYLDGEAEVFVWTIQAVDAKRTRNLEMYSPTFLSAKYHYSFRIKARMNATGTMNDGYLSCGLNFRAGEIDDKARWPVDVVISLAALDSGGRIAESAVMDSLQQTDDTIELAFQRPEPNSELSRGWGNFLCWADHGPELLSNGGLQLQIKLHRNRYNDAENTRAL